MKRYIAKNKNQGVLLGNYIDEYLEPTDTVYLFDNLINKIDFTCIKEKYRSQGGKVYELRQLFSVIAYTYFQGITSNRKHPNLFVNTCLFCTYLEDIEYATRLSVTSN